MKNFVQKGETITFIADRDYRSGEAIVMDGLVVIIHDETPKGVEVVGYTEGVYVLPKKNEDLFKIGQPISINNGVVTTIDKGKERNGLIWGNATEQSSTVAVKINI